jgi:hypothetical protein
VRDAVDLGADLFGVGSALLDDVPLGSGVRLLGLSVHQLAEVAPGGAGVQGSLALAAGDRDGPAAGARGTEDARQRRDAIEHTVDRVRRRYGPEAIRRVSTVGRNKPGPRRVDQG